MRYTKLAQQPTPQSEPLDSRQVKNNAGGYVFQVDDFTRLDRFLILGSDAQTYYQSAKKLTRENADCVLRCVAADAERTIARIVDISSAGRARMHPFTLLQARAVYSSGASVKGSLKCWWQSARSGSARRYRKTRKGFRKLN